MAWQQLAISSDDPIAWPTSFIAPSLMEAISRQITRHLRHSKCKNSKQNKCLCPLCAGLTNPQFQLLLRELHNEPRLNFSGQWIMAKYGHSHGGDPLPPDLYDGPSLILYHVTTLEALPSIKLRGLSPMTRWYIHFTSIAHPQLYETHIYQQALCKRIPKVLSISTRLLLEHNINVFQTLSMNIYILCQPLLHIIFLLPSIECYLYFAALYIRQENNLEIARTISRDIEKTPSINSVIGNNKKKRKIFGKKQGTRMHWNLVT